MTDAEKAPRERRTWSTVLADDAGNWLVVRVERRRRDGGFRTLVAHVVGAGKGRRVQRGASADHADEAKARDAAVALVLAAERQGWRKRARAGFGARPDAFDAAHLPSPAKKK